MTIGDWTSGWYKVDGGYQIAHYFAGSSRKALCGSEWDRIESAVRRFRYCKTCKEKRAIAFARGSR